MPKNYYPCSQNVFNYLFVISECTDGVTHQMPLLFKYFSRYNPILDEKKYTFL